MDWPLLVTTLVLGGCVLLSYVLCFRGTGSSYIDSPFWMGMPRSSVYVLIGFQILAVIGFFLMMVSWLLRPPEGGVLARPHALLLTMVVFLVASAAWAPLTKYASRHWGLASLSLVATAACSLVFVAGAAEETSPRWYVLLGALLLSITVVLSDAGAWNARWIQSSLAKSKSSSKSSPDLVPSTNIVRINM